MYVRTYVVRTYVLLNVCTYVSIRGFLRHAQNLPTVPIWVGHELLGFWFLRTYLSVSLDAESEKTYIRTYVLTYVLNLKGSRGGSVRTYVGGFIGWSVVGRAGPCQNTCQDLNAAQKYDEATGSRRARSMPVPICPAVLLPTYVRKCRG